MRSPLAKVLHPLLGRPMVGWVVAALQDLGADVTLVVHHQEEQVRAAVPGVRYAQQAAPRGTGDALLSALPGLPHEGRVLVTAGDTPLLTAEALDRVVAAHVGPVTVASFQVSDPTGYGRIVRAGGEVRIVEQADCTPEQARITEVNSGVYVFDAAYLHEALATLRPHPPKNEYYLTDLVRGPATVVGGFAPELFGGVNDRAALADARAVLRRRVNRAWALHGVDFADLDSAVIDVTCTLEPDASVGLGVVLEGRTHVAGHVGAHCVLRDTTVAAGARVHPGSICEGASIGAGAIVGPMARLRPGAVIEEGAHIGNYVEVKNARVRRGAKANHLTYLGDADVGEGANIGAGTITCNYDGFAKHRTTIGAGAFVGSNTALVAPIHIGEGAIVGAGSTLIADVPADAVAVERATVKVNLGTAERLRVRQRARAEAAKAAARARVEEPS
jgi:bifunctional UDP-N-acetylglucosamine pyrophosphorylase/glucosamine-1-phosphate N-acetyltransferase